MVHSGKSSHLFIATLPSSYFWIAGTFFFLIKGFELIEYAKKQSLLTGFLGTTALGDLLIGMFYAIPPLLAIGLVGQLIDNRPYLLGKITLISLIVSSTALLLFVIALLFVFLRPALAAEVFTSNYPLYYFTSEIISDNVDVYFPEIEREFSVMKSQILLF